MSQSYYPDDFGLNVSRGVVKGTSHVHKFGAVPSLGNGVTSTVWDEGTLYPWSAFDTANTATVTAAASTADDGKIVTVQGLDDNYEFVQEDIVVSNAGTTGTVEFKRINRAFISTGSENTDDIDITVNGDIVALILAEQAQTLMSVYTVPANSKLYMTKLSASSDASASLFVYKKFPGEDAFRIAHTGELFSGVYDYDFQFPLEIGATADIDLRAASKVGSGNARITTAFCALLIEDGLGS
jgi:hypothetical protein